MADPNEEIHTEMVEDPEVVDCKDEHVADLDEATRRILSTYATIRSKIDDLARAESDIKRFELSIDSERKRLQKTLEGAKLSLRNARVQMGAELAKVDEAGFARASKLIKDENNV